MEVQAAVVGSVAGGEYDAYLRWVSASLTNCHFGLQVEAVSWDRERELYAVDYCARDTADAEPGFTRAYARHIVLGIEPHVPHEFERLVEEAHGTRVLRAAHYLDRRARTCSLEVWLAGGPGRPRHRTVPSR